MAGTMSSKLKEFVKRSLIGTHHEWESHIGNIFRIFDKNLKEYYPYNIMDVGCGNGSRTIRIANYLNVDMNNVYGVDYSENFVTTCRNLFNVNKIDLEIDNIPHDDDTFDVVICNQVLEHLKNYSKVIDELIRVTRKNGYIVIGIPNLAHLINRIYLLFGRQPMCIAMDGSHVRAFTHRSFVAMLGSIQMTKLIDVEGSLMYPLPFFFGRPLARHFVGLSGYVCYLLQKT